MRSSCQTTFELCYDRICKTASEQQSIRLFIVIIVAFFNQNLKTVVGTHWKNEALRHF